MHINKLDKIMEIKKINEWVCESKKTHTVINKNKDKEFSGKGQNMTVNQALDLYDSLGGDKEGYSVEKIQESNNNYQVYHNSYSSAINEISKYIMSTKYNIKKDDLTVAYQDAFFKPKEGKTKKDTIDLYLNGRLQRKALQVQIYGLGNKRYELNMYIN